jgi:hypothetical protein
LVLNNRLPLTHTQNDEGGHAPCGPNGQRPGVTAQGVASVNSAAQGGGEDDDAIEGDEDEEEGE